MSWVILHRGGDQHEEKPMTAIRSSRSSTSLNGLQEYMTAVLRNAAVQSAWAFVPSNSKSHLKDVVYLLLNSHSRLLSSPWDWKTRYYCDPEDYEDLLGGPAFAGVHLWREIK